MNITLSSQPTSFGYEDPGISNPGSDFLKVVEQLAKDSRANSRVNAPLL